MRFFLPILAAALMIGSFAQANELDNEAQVTNETKALSRALPQTLVIRTNATTGEVQVLHSNSRLAASVSSIASISNNAFKTADTSATVGGELDHDSSSSSWYFCWNRGFGGWGGYGGGFGYPYYNYGGYNFGYNPYYAYNYGGWNYGFYRWNYGWY